MVGRLHPLRQSFVRPFDRFEGHVWQMLCVYANRSRRAGECRRRGISGGEMIERRHFDDR